MNKKLQFKLILVLAIILLMVFLFWPPGEKIQYGLDLKGGIHLVLQVVTDDAVDQETGQTVLALEEELRKKDIAFENVIKAEDKLGHILIQNYDPAKTEQVRDMLDNFSGEWDHMFTGSSISLTMKAEAISYFRDYAVRQSIETLWNRVDELGLSEPTIQRQGTGERIIVELPGVENPERVKNIIKTTAFLEWRLVRGGPAPDRETLLQEYNGEIPEGMEVLRGDIQNFSGNYYLVDRVAPVTGNDLRNARRSTDEWNNPAVSFTLKPDAARRFGTFTEENINKPLSIVLDGRIQEVANIGERITDQGIIHGSFTIERAEDISLVLRAGALPATIKFLEERSIGPSLGADSIRQGLTSIIIALVLILIFMVFYYRLAGLNAVGALILNIIILMGALAYFKAHLTLPGIAGIILTIGMAVDANVLVFERIREELAQGKSVLSSIASGFSRAFRTILDANVTTIIAAIFLFQFGTGPIRGFAVTLIIGITASMFTAVFVSRLIFDLTHNKKKKRDKLSI
ncbi:MAG: protein translocase subunit SecD [Candidatus Aminicenantes bacterium]|nr:protein translocase subunit SecD [Candidatus Aminicenantes bacterium]